MSLHLGTPYLFLVNKGSMTFRWHEDRDGVDFKPLDYTHVVWERASMSTTVELTYRLANGAAAYLSVALNFIGTARFERWVKEGKRFSFRLKAEGEPVLRVSNSLADPKSPGADEFEVPLRVVSYMDYSKGEL